MNNDLEQFSDLELEGMAHGNNPVANAYRELLAFRRAAKQAKPFGYLCEWDNGNQVIYYGEAGSALFDDWSVMPSVHKNLPLYTTPQPAHTEQDGWTSSDAANAALVMLDRIDTTDPVDDDRIEGIQRIIRQIVNSPAIPVGWKLVPIEPNQEMVDAHISGMQSAGFSRAYRAMLAAAPKPESE